MRFSNFLCYVLLGTCLLGPAYSHHKKRRKYQQLLGLALDGITSTTTTTTPAPSHFSFVMAPTPPPKQSLVSLDSISTAATLGKEYNGYHDSYTTSSTPYTTYSYAKEQPPTTAPSYVGGLGPFSHDTFNKYYANNGMYSNELGAGYWGGASNYKPDGGSYSRPNMESKYSYDGYDSDYGMTYDQSSYDYGSDSIVGSIGSYFSYLFMDPGSILMAAAALSLKALVLNLVLVATNRTGRRRRRRAEEDSFEFEDGASINSLDSIVETIQLTFEAPEKCRARMFCEAGSRIRTGRISTNGPVSSIARYFGGKMEERAYMTLSSAPPVSTQRSGPTSECKQHFLACPEQMHKLNDKLIKLSRYLPLIELIPLEDEGQPILLAMSEEPT